MGLSSPTGDAHVEVLSPSVTAVRSLLAGQSRVIRGSDYFQHDPAAPPASYFRGVYRDLLRSQVGLAQTVSDAFDALSAQTASEAAQSLFADPSSLVFAQHAELFGCLSTGEHAALGLERAALREERTALQQELAAARLRITELEGRPVPVTPPASASGGSHISLDTVQGVLATLEPAEAKDLAQLIVRCCWRAWLTVLSS